MSRRAVRRAITGLLVVLAALCLRGPFASSLAAIGVTAREHGQPWRAVRLLRVAHWLAASPATGLELALAEAERGDRRSLDRTLDTLPVASEAEPSWRYRRLLLEAERRAREGDTATAAAHVATASELAATPGARAAVQLASSELAAGPADDPVAAARQIEQAIELARQAAATRLEAAAHLAAGAVCWRLRSDAAACSREHDLPALALARRSGDLQAEAAARARIGLSKLRQGEYEASESELLAAARLQHRVGDLDALAETYAWLGVLEVSRRRSRQAHAHYSRSLELAERLGVPRIAGATRYLLADYHLRAGDYARALATCEEALAAARPPWPAERRRLLVTAANAALHQGDGDAALARYRRALAEMPPGRDDTLRLQATLMVGHAMLERDDPTAAAVAFVEAATLAAASGDWGQLVLITLARADLADRLGDREQALAHLDAAATIEARTFGTARTLLYRSQYWQVFRRIRALLFDGRSSVVEREAATRLLFRFVEQMRYRSLRSLLVRGTASQEESPTRAPSSDRTPTREDPSDSYGPVAIPAVAELAGDDLEAMLAAYERAQLAASLSPAARATLARAVPVELAAVQRRLGGDTALVQYVFADDAAFALVVTARDLEVVALPLDRRSIEVKIRLLRARLGSGDNDWRPVAQSLDAGLVEPLRQRGLLDGVRRLGIVPMGLLAELPFAVLERDHHPGGGQAGFLVDSFELFYAPSASVLMARWSLSPSTAPQPVLAIGRGIASAGLPPLPHAVMEARDVASLLGGVALLDAAATEADLRRHAPQARVIHLATHAAGEPGNPTLGRLALAAAPAGDGWLSVPEILALELDADLVTLSGCRTGLSHTRTGNDLAEDDRTGLVEAFLHAGARTVVASLWPVGDRATARLMTAFYRQLGPLGPAAALAAAQRDLLADPDGVALASTWAAFVAVGAPDRAAADQASRSGSPVP